MPEANSHVMRAPLMEGSLQVLAVEVEGWPGLAEKVRVEFSAERTALVGRNGAGKSVVLAAIVHGAGLPLSPGRRRTHFNEARSFRCEIGAPGAVHYVYEYVCSYALVDEPDAIRADPSPRPEIVWTERCWDTAGEYNLWSVAKNELTLAGHGETIKMPAGYGFLSIGRGTLPVMGPARTLPALLGGFDLVCAGVPRPIGTNRKSVYVQGHRSKPTEERPESVVIWRMGENGPSDRVEELAEEIAKVFETSRDTFDEFAAVLKRLGVVGDTRFVPLETPNGPPGLALVGLPTFDGVNIGLLSDGTLRIIEIVLHLLRPANRVLFIEEPETAVHPGLLQRLLNELRAYEHDRQIVVSTHSPYVVNWFEPNDLRLVERLSGVTSVRRLGLREIDQITEYLTNDGLLDEYVFDREDESDGFDGFDTEEE